MTVKLEIKGIDKLQKFYSQFPEITGQAIKSFTDTSLKIIEQEASARAPVGTSGQLRADTQRVATERGGSLKYRQKYAVPVHEGTKPHHPPVRPGQGLHRWAQLKGINPWAVAKSISRKGTKANPFLERAVQKVEGTIQRLFSKTLIDTYNKTFKKIK